MNLRGASPADYFVYYAQLGLARAYAVSEPAAEFKPKARTAYQDFLAIWKDADPGTPLLKQVQSEYARLTP
jgi:hypothetical protein